MQPDKITRVIHWKKLRQDDAERVCKLRVKDTSNVIIIGHPAQRQQVRGIIDADVYEILKSGMVVDAPVKNRHGCWEFLITKNLRGGREAGVAAIICEKDDKIIVKTCEWIDPRRL